MPRASDNHVMDTTNATGSKQRRLIWKREPQRHLFGISPYRCPECRMSAHQRILLSNAKYVVEEDKLSGKERTFYYPNEKVFVGLKPGQTPPPPQTAYIATPPLSPQSQPKPLDADGAQSSSAESDVASATIQIQQALEEFRKKAAGSPIRQPEQLPSTTEPAPLKDEDEDVQHLPSDGSNKNADASTSRTFVSYSETSGFWTATQTKLEEPHVELDAPSMPSTHPERQQETDEVKLLNEVQDQDTQPSKPCRFSGQVNVPMDCLEDVVMMAATESVIAHDQAMASLEDEDHDMTDEALIPTEQRAKEPALQTQRIMDVVDEFLEATRATQAPPAPTFTPKISVSAPAQPPAPTTQALPLQSTYAPPPTQSQLPQNPVVVGPVQSAWDIWARLAADVPTQIQPQTQTRAHDSTSPPLKMMHQTQTRGQDVPLASSSESITAQPVRINESQETSVEHLDSDLESERNFRGAVARLLRKQSESLDEELAVGVVVRGLGIVGGRPIRPLPARVGRSKMVASMRSAVRGSEDDLRIRLEWERELEQSPARKKRRREDDSGYESNSSANSSANSNFKADSKSTSNSAFRMPTSDDEDDKPRPVKRVRFSDPLESIHYIPACTSPVRSPRTRGRPRVEVRRCQEQRQNEKVKGRVMMKAEAGAQAQVRKMSRFCLQVSGAVSGFFSSRMSRGLDREL